MSVTGKLKTVIARDGPYCWICGLCCDVTLKDHNSKGRPNWIMATRDHIVPLSGGGSQSLKNTRLAHRYCNLKRGSNEVDDFLRVQMRTWMYKQGYTERIAEAELLWFKQIASLFRLPDAVRPMISPAVLPLPAPKIMLIRKTG